MQHEIKSFVNSSDEQELVNEMIELINIHINNQSNTFTWVERLNLLMR